MTLNRSQFAKRSSFTLTELIVVMGIIGILAAVTAVSYRSVAKDAKLSSGINTVASVLDTARGLAMKNNKPTMVAFVPTVNESGETRLQAMIAEWTGTVLFQDVEYETEAGVVTVYSVFEPFTLVPRVKIRDLPRGVMVAGPSYSLSTAGEDHDSEWFVPSNLAKVNGGEAAGRIVGVMFAPDGTTHTSNPATATSTSNFQFIDFDNFIDPAAGDRVQNRDSAALDIDAYFLQQEVGDEVCVELVPFFAIFDEDAARKTQGDDDWLVESTRDEELTEFINENAHRIHFNRYTGVVLK